MSDDPFRDDMESWQSGDTGHASNATTVDAVFREGIDPIVPTAKANATIVRDFNGKPWPGANQPPHECRTCAEWGTPGPYLGDYARCSVLGGITDPWGHLLNGTVMMPARFPGCGKWTARETPDA